eukprot:7084315-Pyramimonas_sp.AAC.1
MQTAYAVCGGGDPTLGVARWPVVRYTSLMNGPHRADFTSAELVPISMVVVAHVSHHSLFYVDA